MSAETGIPYQVLLAIPGNETGWGQAVAGNNYFGIKGSNPKTGKNTGQVGTWEVVNGQRVDIKDTFRAYGSYEESARDFASFLKDNPRYSKALDYLREQPNDWRGFTRRVHEAGYATDPKWSDKIISIGNGLDSGPSATVSTDRAQMDTSTGQPKVRIKGDPSGRVGVRSVIDVGSTAIGSRYQWGGAGGRTSFDAKLAPTDCSGFVAWAYQQATGLKLTAQTTGMWNQTRAVDAKSAQPGDLVFYNKGEGANLEHVGIYVGNGQMLHDSSLNPNGGVDITPLWSGASFRRVDGVDPSQARYGTNPELARIRARDRSARSQAQMLPPGDWQAFKAEGEFRPETMGMGAGQESDLSQFDEGELLRQRAEKERLEQEQQEAQNRETDEARRRQERADNPVGSFFSDLGSKVQDTKQAVEQGLGAYNQAVGETLSQTPNEALGRLGAWADVKPPSETAQRHLGGESVGIDIPNIGLGGAIAKPPPPTMEQVVTGEQPKAPSTHIEIPGQIAGVAETIGEQHIGPGVYVGRNVAGREQLKVTNPEYAALAQENEELNGRTDRWPEPGTEERTAQIGARMLEIERASDLQELAKQNPNLETYQTIGELGQAGVATALLPGAVVRSGPGLARAATSVAIDPTSAPFVAGGEVLADMLKAAKGAEKVAHEATAAQATRSADNLAAMAEPLRNTPEGQHTADALALVTDPRTVATGGGDTNSMLARAGAQLTGDVPDPTAVVRATATVGEEAGPTVSSLTSRFGGQVKRGKPGLSMEGLGTNSPTIVFRDDDGVARGALQMYHEDDQLKNLAVAVDPAYQRQGIGTQMFDAAKRAGYDVESVSGASGYTPAGAAFTNARRSPAREMAEAATGAEAAAKAMAFMDTPAEEAARRERVMEQIARSRRELGEQAAEASATERVTIDHPIARELTRPVTPHEEIKVLQQAALHLNDSALQKEAAELQELVNTGQKVEPMTGNQLRRRINMAVAEATTTPRPGFPLRGVDEILSEVDKILDDAGMPLLTHKAASEAGVAAPDALLEVNQLWHTTDVGKEVERVAAERARARAAAAKPFSQPQTPAFEALARGTASGTIGAVGGAASALPDEGEEPDWNEIGKRGLMGFGVGMVGVGAAPWAAKHLYDGPVVQEIVDAGRKIFAPTHRLKDTQSREIIARWAHRQDLADNLGNKMRDTWEKVFGHDFTMNDAMWLEQTGTLPNAWRDKPGAEDALKLWNDWTEWARKYDIIKDPLSLGWDVKTYLPHVLEDEWKKALDEARGVVELAGREPKKANYVSRNPFQYYEHERKHATLAEGAAAGVAYSDRWAEIMGNYVKRAVETANHQALIEELTAHARTVDPDIMKRAMQTGLADADVIRVPLDSKDIVKGGEVINDIRGFKGAGVDDIRVSSTMKEVLNNIMGDDQLWSDMPAVRWLFDAGQFMRHNNLSGIDMYQGFYNVASSMAALTGGHGQQAWTSSKDALSAIRSGDWGAAGKAAGEAPKAALKMLADPVYRASSSLGMVLNPNAYDKWAKMPETQFKMQQAMMDGLTLGGFSDRPDEFSWVKDWASSALNTSVTGLASYQGSLALGASDDEAKQSALRNAGLAALVTAPIFGRRFKAGQGLNLPGPSGQYGIGVGKEQASLMEAVSHGVWDRQIPFLKMQVYDAWKGVMGGEAAAEFTNEILGGQNLRAIARSRNVQDAMRFVLMTPGWQEGFVRSMGNAVTDVDGPMGHMNRVYWATAVVGSAVALEALNLGFSGHWSWQNEPGKTLTVDMSRIYDAAGVDRTDQQTGQPKIPYWDILGPWRSWAEPMAETSRWALAGAYGASGIKAEDLPLNQQITGQWGEVPKPDPADAWKRFALARAGWIPAAADEILGNKDFAGRPLDRDEDPEYQGVLNRAWQLFARMVPAGHADIARAQARGDPWQAMAYQYVTGHRVEYGGAGADYWRDYEEALKEANKTGEDWRKKREDARTHNEEQDRKADAILSGVLNGDNSKASPGESNMTGRQRADALHTIGEGRTSVTEQQMDLLAGIPDGPKKDAIQQELQRLRKYKVVPGGDVSSDLQDRQDLDMDELVRLSWNRDPHEIARLKGTLPPPQGLLEQAGTAVREALDRPAGYDEAQRLQRERARWTTDVAETYDIDQAVLQDLIKAHVYQVADAEGGFSPPLLPGVSSKQLDEISTNWRQAGLDDKGMPLSDPVLAAQRKQQYIMRTAQELNVDPQALTVRAKLRNMPTVDSSEAAIGYSHALDVMNQSRTYKYQDENGNPVGLPDDWVENDKKLDSKDARWDYNVSRGEKFYYKNGQPDHEMTELNRQRERAKANRWRDVLNSEHADDYYRYFGDGAGMTDKEWRQYNDGTLDLYRDEPNPREAQNRIQARRVWSALTPEERRTANVESAGEAPVSWQGMNERGQIVTRRTSLQEYINYINTYSTDRRKLLGDLDSSPPDQLSSGGSSG